MKLKKLLSPKRIRRWFFETASEHRVRKLRKRTERMLSLHTHQRMIRQVNERQRNRLERMVRRQNRRQNRRRERIVQRRPRRRERYPNEFTLAEI